MGLPTATVSVKVMGDIQVSPSMKHLRKRMRHPRKQRRSKSPYRSGFEERVASALKDAGYSASNLVDLLHIGDLRFRIIPVDSPFRGPVFMNTVRLDVKQQNR